MLLDKIELRFQHSDLTYGTSKSAMALDGLEEVTCILQTTWLTNLAANKQTNQEINN